MKTEGKRKTYSWLLQRRKQRSNWIAIGMLLLLLVAAVKSAKSQQGEKLPSTLSAAELITIVKQHHPVAKQADIEIEKSKAGVTAVRGLFDPLLTLDAANKTFDGTEYYNYAQPEIKIPTWYGIELSAGMEYLSGSRTDPQATLGQTSFAGLSIPLAKNLLMDKRRAALQQARMMVQFSVQERRSRVNDLLKEALEAYWQWAAHYQVYLLTSEAVKVNENRIRLVKTAFVNGDRAALDTTEALTQLQQFQYLQNEAWLSFLNAGISLSVFLWQQSEQPYELPVSIIPEGSWQTNYSSVALPVFDEFMQAAMTNHPELKQYDYKLDILEVERKLKFQELLPNIRLKYNNLGKGYNVFKTAATPLLENNYQYGVSFAMPLRLSQGRGEYRQARLKITETRLDLVLKQQQIGNKVKSYYNELTNTLRQLSLLEKNYGYYQTLLRGEEARLLNGESTLFIINARETKLLEAAQKLVETKAKFQKTIYMLQWAAGLLGV
jgi:outer membrane protein TolC